MTCPAGHTVTITPGGAAVFGLRCRHCPLRPRCTTAAKGKTVRVGVHDAELVYGRATWRDPAVVEHYRRHRPKVERTIAWLAAGRHRRLRYRGVARNQLWLTIRVSALNLRRLITLGLTSQPTGWALTR